MFPVKHVWTVTLGFTCVYNGLINDIRPYKVKV